MTDKIENIIKAVQTAELLREELRLILGESSP